MYRITLAVFILELLLTRIGAVDPATWVMEVFPVFIAIPFVWHFGRKNQISTLLQILIMVHALILSVGGHYTYALTPVGDWIKNLGIGERNNYDKLGHFMQGFVPAFATREILMRIGFWKDRKVFMSMVVVLVCGGISALYEIIEMLAAVAMGQGADAFLGTQGYVWDTQTDMATAIIGAIVAVLMFVKLQEKQVLSSRVKTFS
ncbi:MAG TPA: DUF2238 domain-containing protein [Fibrobacteres bacterium]|jgi:putative membrane protein|nr:DUF2238 domain-containing protein [Fibrobacterota bacterium]